MERQLTPNTLEGIAAVSGYMIFWISGGLMPVSGQRDVSFMLVDTDAMVEAIAPAESKAC